VSTYVCTVLYIQQPPPPCTQHTTHNTHVISTLYCIHSPAGQSSKSVLSQPFERFSLQAPPPPPRNPECCANALVSGISIEP